MAEISISDPMYVVRRRLGEELDKTENRDQTADVLEHVGSEMDKRIMEDIRSTYEEEMNDMTSGGPPMGGGPMGAGGPMGGMMDGDDIDPEEAKEQVQKFMRLTALEAAYRSYPIAKCVVMN